MEVFCVVKLRIEICCSVVVSTPREECHPRWTTPVNKDLLEDLQSQQLELFQEALESKAGESDARQKFLESFAKLQNQVKDLVQGLRHDNSTFIQVRLYNVLYDMFLGNLDGKLFLLRAINVFL